MRPLFQRRHSPVSLAARVVLSFLLLSGLASSGARAAGQGACEATAPGAGAAPEVSREASSLAEFLMGASAERPYEFSTGTCINGHLTPAGFELGLAFHDSLHVWYEPASSAASLPARFDLSFKSSLSPKNIERRALFLAPEAQPARGATATRSVPCDEAKWKGECLHQWWHESFGIAAGAEYEGESRTVGKWKKPYSFTFDLASRWVPAPNTQEEKYKLTLTKDGLTLKFSDKHGTATCHYVPKRRAPKRCAEPAAIARAERKPPTLSVPAPEAPRVEVPTHEGPRRIVDLERPLPYGGEAGLAK